MCITRVFVLLFFILDTAGAIASNQLRLENITNCRMIKLRFMHSENDHSYDLQKLIDDAEMDQAVTLRRNRHRISGRAEAERLPLLYLLHIIEKENLNIRFRSVRFSVGESSNFVGKLSPLLTSTDIRSDVSFKIEVSNDLVTFFMVEMHSGTSPDSYEHTLSKAVSNTVDLLRSLKMYTPEINEISSLVFPKCGYRHCVTVIRCTFVAAPPQFNVVAECLPLSEVRTRVLDLLRGSLTWVDLARKERLDPHSYFVRFGSKELKDFGDMVQASGECSQKVTSHSIVITDKKKYWKYIVRESEAETVSYVIRNIGKCDHLLSYEPVDLGSHISASRHLFVSPAMLGPLEYMDANESLFDFARLVKEALSSLHQLKWAHLDVRVPNVCFSLKGEDCKAVLIDMDRIQVSNTYTLPSFSGPYYQKHVSWQAERLDWKQLGLTIKLFTRDEEDDFIEELISEGKLDVCYCTRTLSAHSLLGLLLVKRSLLFLLRQFQTNNFSPFLIDR